MKATQQAIKLPTRNDALLAATLGQIYTIVLNPNFSVAETVLNKPKLDQLMRILLAAPEELLPSC